MRKKLEKYAAISCAFLIGALLAGIVSVKYVTMPILEQVNIRSNAMEAYKAVSTLELLKAGKNDAAVDFLEWQADEGLIGLSHYTSTPRLSSRLDSFALKSIAASKSYRERYPRITESKFTDSVVGGVLSANLKNRKPVIQGENAAQPMPVQ